MTLRDAVPADLELLWQIDQACFPPGIAYSQDELHFYLGQPKAKSLIAEEKQRSLGFVIGSVHAPKASSALVGHVITIDVLPAHRRRGVGDILLGAVEAFFVAQRCRESLLETAVDNDSAIRFYKKHGYAVLKTLPRYYHRELDGLLMGKSLPTQENEG